MDGSFPEQISCGELLRQAREQRGLTLQHVAHATKIPLRHLDALERDQFAVLPGAFYRRAEVRAYADAVGLDRSIALARLHEALAEAQPQPPASVQPPPPPPLLANLRARLSMLTAPAIMTGAIALAMWTSRPDAPDLAAIQPAAAPPVRTIEPPPDPNARSPIDQPHRAPAPAVDPQLTIVTEPAGARVTVNGVGWGVTPVTVRHLTPGRKTVRVTLGGYVTEERLLQLDAGARVTSVHIPLRTQSTDAESFR